jgi:hypothetical protein
LRCNQAALKRISLTLGEIAGVVAISRAFERARIDDRSLEAASRFMFLLTSRIFYAGPQGRELEVSPRDQANYGEEWLTIITGQWHCPDAACRRAPPCSTRRNRRDTGPVGHALAPLLVTEPPTQCNRRRLFLARRNTEANWAPVGRKTRFRAIYRGSRPCWPTVVDSYCAASRRRMRPGALRENAGSSGSQRRQSG